MGFKNMKRDDHGHVISNDETDGQKCQHASGQADKVEDQKYNKEMKEAQEQNAAMSEVFDDDYDEEFNTYDRNEKIAEDINEYFDDNQLNDLKRYCDRYDVDFDKAKLELAKYFDKMQKDGGFSQVDAAKAALEALEDDIVMGDLDDESQENNRDKLYEEAGKIIENAGMKDVDLSAAHQLKNDYVDGKINKEELINKYRDAFKNNKDIVSTMKKPDDDFVLPIPTDEDRKQIRNEHAPDKKEQELINKDLAQRDLRKKEIKDNAKKFADLMKNGKKEEAWNFLNTLSNEDVAYMFEELGE